MSVFCPGNDNYSRLIRRTVVRYGSDNLRNCHLLTYPSGTQFWQSLRFWGKYPAKLKRGFQPTITWWRLVWWPRVSWRPWREPRPWLTTLATGCPSPGPVILPLRLGRMDTWGWAVLTLTACGLDISHLQEPGFFITLIKTMAHVQVKCREVFSYSFTCFPLVYTQVRTMIICLKQI